MRLGFIGCGNMASAMMKGIIENNIISSDDITGYDILEACVRNAEEKLGIHAANNNRAVIETSDIVILAVKPQYYEDVIAEIRDCVKDNQIIVTIAPGKTLAWVAESFGKEVKLVRTMPNTPALVGEGITAVCYNDNVTDEELDSVVAILKGFGKCQIIPENLMDVVVSVSSSSPAYVFMFIEAMADGAVADGMPRAQAYEFAAQAVLGSAKMVLETGKHPGELKDMVCSPAGTTIEAVRVLEEKGMRSAVIEAMKACTKKARGI